MVLDESDFKFLFIKVEFEVMVEKVKKYICVGDIF